jgi:hypothetical protein
MERWHQDLPMSSCIPSKSLDPTYAPFETLRSICRSYVFLTLWEILSLQIRRWKSLFQVITQYYDYTPVTIQPKLSRPLKICSQHDQVGFCSSRRLLSYHSSVYCSCKPQCQSCTYNSYVCFYMDDVNDPAQSWQIDFGSDVHLPCLVVIITTVRLAIWNCAAKT